MSARQEDETLSLRQRSPAGICDWLDDAISLGGEAIFGRPNVIEPRDAQDQLQSRFVLKVMAYHIGATLGSVFDSDEGDQPLPVGALALAACAVERAFLWYKDDQPKGLPMTPFSRNHAGKDTGKWRETAVQELVDRTHRFERLLSRARALVTVVPPPALPSGTTQQGSATNRLYVRERSSSPPVASLYDDE
ncbi:hypothetical protein K466DRAFT_317720 [Polyporus arcularius HHB13444]|uniref:Uncharacterized protein n=1 Tax=Polyporus arcularius HHB13444 TaxID=1314778 RepID=A0A5C3NX33_9APHY|nr:hypothetical protein K466DRAFT_317720 [Polyporus arcularius HHB13444]